MPATDTVAARTVALVVIVVGLLYYHFYFYYFVRGSVYGSIRSSLQNLWSVKILPHNEDYFTTKLITTIQALDSYNSIVDPIVQNSLNVVGADESLCNRGMTYLGLGIEMLAVISLIVLVFVSIRTASFLPGN